MFITIGIFTPLYSISLFLPTILKDLGFSANKAQLMTVPPYVVACVCTIGASYAADKARQRAVFILSFQAIAIIGFLMLATNGIPHVQYAGTFFAAAGMYRHFTCQGLLANASKASTLLSLSSVRGTAITLVAV